MGISPPNAIGKKIIESAPSPTRVDTMALKEKCLPFDAIFILLIT